jgi:hypothetical protein
MTRKELGGLIMMITGTATMGIFTVVAVTTDWPWVAWITGLSLGVGVHYIKRVLRRQKEYRGGDHDEAEGR